MEIFERASRKKLRFSTNKGLITAEDLWDLSLTSLDTIAKAVNKQLREESEESFITPSSSATKTDLTLRLDILKHVIGVKMTQAEARKKATERTEELKTLQSLLADKKVKELEGLSPEEIQRRIAALSTSEAEV